MEKTILENRIVEKAEERFEKDFKQAHKLLSENPITCGLTIKNGEGACLSLCSSMGYCPATDLINLSDRRLLREHTNYDKIKARLIEKYIKEETDKILNQLAMIQEYLDGSS